MPPLVLQMMKILHTLSHKFFDIYDSSSESDGSLFFFFRVQTNNKVKHIPCISLASEQIYYYNFVNENHVDDVNNDYVDDGYPHEEHVDNDGYDDDPGLCSTTCIAICVATSMILYTTINICATSPTF